MDVALVMFKESGQPKEFPIEPGKTVIGRKEDCDLRIPLADISRRHAVVMVGETVTIRDLGSANGTYLNNKRISEHELAAGDHIVIGPVVFTVRINGEPTDVKPVQTRLETRGGTDANVKVTARPTAAKAEKVSAGKHDDDPISALEALAASGDTAALGMEDSSFLPGPDDSNAS
jgi:pSer/pThr/pTyr-binding forkhead associated (FHA) protein